MSCHGEYSKDMDLTSKTEGVQDKRNVGEAVLVVSFSSQKNKSNTGRVLECSPKFETIIQRVQDAGEGHGLAVIGITGASPQENFWLMNQFARCLQQSDRPSGDELSDKMNKESGDMINDYTPEDEPRCHITEGIWMWSRPFIIPTANNPSQKLAVLLMTVQGCSDHTSLTDEEKQAIFGLTLLTSSSFIVIETSQIDTSTFSSLHEFIQHAREAVKEQFNSTGFQEIAFFIREWISPDHGHGLQEGQNYLQKCLVIKPDMSDEEKEYRRCILETFERHQATLLPHPGRPVNEDGWTSVNLVNPDFQACVQEFIASTVISLAPQKILSKLSSPAAMNLLISAYLKAFNEAEEECTLIAESDSQISSWAKSYEEALRNKISTKGARYLPQEKITKWHRDLKAIYMALVKNDKVLATHSKNLESTIEQTFTTISIENETAKLQLEDENRAREDQTTVLMKKGLEIYIENMDMLCSEDERLTMLDLTKRSKRCMAIALRRVESEAKKVFPHPDRFSEFCSQFNASLSTEFARYEQENTLRLEAIETEMRENVNDAVDMFKGELSPLIETVPNKEAFVKIAELHDQILESCVQALEEIQCPDRLLTRKYLSLLKTKLSKAKEEALLDLEKSLKATEATREGLLASSMELVTTTLDAILFNGEAQDEQDLEDSMIDAARSISDQLQSDLELKGAQDVTSYLHRLAAFVSSEQDRIHEENRKRTEELMRSQLENLEEFYKELYSVIVEEYEDSIKPNPFMSDDEADVIIAQKLNNFYHQGLEEISKIQAESAQTEATEELSRRQEDLKIDLKSRMRQIREAGGDQRAKLVTSCIQLASSNVVTKLTALQDPSVEMIDEIIHVARENVQADLKSKSRLPEDEKTKALEEILVHLDADFQKRRQEAITKMEKQEKVIDELVRKVVGHVGSEIESSFQDGKFYRAGFLNRALQSVDEIHGDLLRILTTEGIQATPKINELFKEKAEERVEGLRARNEANLQAALHDLAGGLPQWYKLGLNDIKSNAEFEDILRQILSKAHRFIEEKTNFTVQDDPEISKKIQDVCAVSTEKAKSQLERDFMRQSMDLLGPAEANYRQSMDEFIGTNNLPLHPSDLHQFHDHSVHRALQRLSRQHFIPPKGRDYIQNYLGLVYRKYEERNLLKCADENNDVIGIDLGTTTSCVAIFQHGEARVIKDEGGHALNPSWVYFDEEHKPVVGHTAKNEAHIHTEDTVYDAKRLIGRDMNDPNVQKNMKKWLFKVVPGPDGRPRILARGKRYEAEEISARVLKKMAEIAEADLELKVTKAVITVPANFNDRQRGATIQAAELAGLKVLQIINEPTAAALAYARDWKRMNRTVLVFDFGGGTLDVTILKTAEGDKKAKESLGMQLQVLSTAGDTNLGGEDLDDRLVEHCAREFEAMEGIKLLEAEPDKPTSILGAKRRSLRLRQYCEKAKCNLTAADVTTVAVDSIYGDKNLTMKVTRPEFEAICEDLFQRAIDVVGKALEDAKLTARDIDDVVMVGGSSRIPRMKTLLRDFLQCPPIALNQKIDIQEAVARGAAIQACILNGGKTAGNLPRVKDVQPFSLGIEIIGGDMSVIIPRNSQIPLTIMKQYQTTANNQCEVLVTIFSGEEQVAKENFQLGLFRLLRIPPGPKGSQVINVEMKIDQSGLLNVTATCVSNGVTQNIKIEENRGRLTENQLEYLSGRFVC